MRFPEWSVAYSDPAEGVNCFWIMNGAMVVGSVYGPQSDKRQEQRAHLIAAAPDMYEALANLENDDGHIPPSAWKLVQDALAKARGETVK